MTGRRTASNDCPASRRWASGNLCRFTRRSSAHVAPKRHTAPRARLQAFSVISSEWRKPPAGQVRERWQDLWPFFASSLHQLRRGTMKHTFTSIAAATALSVSALASAAPPDDAQAIRPLHVHVPNAELVDLRKRLAATRWPDRETVEDTSQGVQLATIQALVQYWGTQYDWRTVESELNSLPQFTTKIHGPRRWQRVRTGLRYAFRRSRVRNFRSVRNRRRSDSRSGSRSAPRPTHGSRQSARGPVERSGLRRGAGGALWLGQPDLTCR